MACQTGGGCLPKAEILNTDDDNDDGSGQSVHVQDQHNDMLISIIAFVVFLCIVLFIVIIRKHKVGSSILIGSVGKPDVSGNVSQLPQ